MSLGWGGIDVRRGREVVVASGGLTAAGPDSRLRFRDLFLVLRRNFRPV